MEELNAIIKTASEIEAVNNRIENNIVNELALVRWRFHVTECYQAFLCPKLEK